jgi:hypothetical protein
LLSNGATASGVRKMLTQEVIEHLPSWVLFPDTEKAECARASAPLPRALPTAPTRAAPARAPWPAAG